MQTRTIGIVFVVLGVVMMIYTRFHFMTSKKIVDIGPIEITKEVNNPVQWSPILGALLLVSGIILIIVNRSKKV
ncbi:MAG: hypothetical protein WAS55_09515 [Saprospiraceae bacterium]|nr:hypothetical protein [Saprospiraceae bacterium]